MGATMDVCYNECTKNKWLEMVTEFHEAFGNATAIDIGVDEVLGAWYIASLRETLIQEEFDELIEATGDYLSALENEDIDTALDAKVDMLDSVVDLLYVVIGFGITFGLPMDEAFKRIHKSNMAKLGIDGKPICRDDGKILKGPYFQPPVLEDLL